MYVLTAVRLERSSSRAGSREEDEGRMDSVRLVRDEELSPFRRLLSDDVSPFLSDLRLNIVAPHWQCCYPRRGIELRLKGWWVLTR